MNKIRGFIEKKIFKNFILGVIIFNSIQLGLMTINDLNITFYNILKYIDLACLIIYIIEMILKFIAYNIVGYFKKLWNCFDFIIITISIISEFSTLSSIKIFRSLRVFRSLRSLRGFKLFSSINSLQMVIATIGKTLPGVAWTSVFILIIIYLYSIIGVTEFGNDFQDLFGTIPRSFYSLFQVSTFESWSTGICRPIMKKYSFAWLYFIPFLIVSSIVAMNILTGIIVNAICYDTNDNDNENDEDNENEEKYNIEAIKSELKIINDYINNIDEILKKGYFEDLEGCNNKISIKVKEIDKDEII